MILTSDFLLLVIIVAGGEELSEDESRHIDLLHLVLHHRNTLPIIPYTDGVVFTKRKKQTNTYYTMFFCDTEESCGFILQLTSHCGRNIGYSEILSGYCTVLYITHTSILILMQDMLLSLCLLSAAFTVGRI